MTGRPLEDEIERARLEISADSVSMTVSELTNLYREGVLVIRPEFQRLFRWTNEQKSRLVESILLGIPLPSLFVAQSIEGKWELVDGLQRVSTILELQGLLKDSNGHTTSFVLSATKFLPHLEGYCWQTSRENQGKELSSAQKLDIRLARLDIRVIKRSSDPKAKFDLFQRLNSFGSALTAQEIRSAMMAGIDSASMAWLVGLSRTPSFKQCVGLNDRQIDEQYDLELVLRFLMLHNMERPTRTKLADFSLKLDDWSTDLATTFDERQGALRDAFERTFDYLAASGDENLFRSWDEKRAQFRGGFRNTSFEVLAMGAGYWISRGETPRSDALAAARELTRALSAHSRFATGLATADRLVKTLPAGRKLMSDDNSTLTWRDLV